ncbi:hypothetical protein IWX90DRAFT_505300 [Phyllosticta citrichinensis]|uniref:Uncharacterized protein n=1 Tax=Phyllosticta citrichinensis TaxID=1130410 RepID=A0ABR1XRJ2_9PEZI
MARTKSLARRASSKVFKFFIARHCASLDTNDAVPAKPVSQTSTGRELRTSASQSTISEANMVSKFSLDSSDFEDDDDDRDEHEEEEKDDELDTSPATRVVLPVQPSDAPAPAPTANLWKRIRPKRIRPKRDRLVGRAAAPPRANLHKHIRRSVALSTIFELLEPPSRGSRPPKRDLRREERSDSFITGWKGLPPVKTTADDGLEGERRRDRWSYGPIVFTFDWPG